MPMPAQGKRLRDACLTLRSDLTVGLVQPLNSPAASGKNLAVRNITNPAILHSHSRRCRILDSGCVVHSVDARNKHSHSNADQSPLVSVPGCTWTPVGYGEVPHSRQTSARGADQGSRWVDSCTMGCERSSFRHLALRRSEFVLQAAIDILAGAVKIPTLSISEHTRVNETEAPKTHMSEEVATEVHQGLV